jgi:hypothetical protein
VNPTKRFVFDLRWHPDGITQFICFSFYYFAQGQTWKCSPSYYETEEDIDRPIPRFNLASMPSETFADMKDAFNHVWERETGSGVGIGSFNLAKTLTLEDHLAKAGF